jgi:hypothetical protein
MQMPGSPSAYSQISMPDDASSSKPLAMPGGEIIDAQTTKSFGTPPPVPGYGAPGYGGPPGYAGPPGYGAQPPPESASYNPSVADADKMGWGTAAALGGGVGLLAAMAGKPGKVGKLKPPKHNPLSNAAALVGGGALGYMAASALAGHGKKHKGKKYKKGKHFKGKKFKKGKGWKCK